MRSRMKEKKKEQRKEKKKTLPPFVVFNLTGKTKNQTKQTCNLPLDLNDKLAGIASESCRPEMRRCLNTFLTSACASARPLRDCKPPPRQCSLSLRARTRSDRVSRQVTLTQTQKTLLKRLLVLHQEYCRIWHKRQFTSLQ